MQRTMTAEEAQAVVRLQAERGGDPNAVSVDDVAEALNVPRSQVETLLAEVRQSQVNAHARAVEEHRKRDMRRLAGAFVFALLVMAGGAMFYKIRQDRSEDFPAMPGTTVTEAVKVSDAPPVPDVAAPPAMPIGTEIPGIKQTLRIQDGTNFENLNLTGRSLEQIAADFETWKKAHSNAVARSADADKRTREALSRGDTADPGIGQIPVVFVTTSGDFPAELPNYTGTDPTNEALAAKMRQRILGEYLGIPVE